MNPKNLFGLRDSAVFAPQAILEIPSEFSLNPDRLKHTIDVYDECDIIVSTARRTETPSK
ncbi:hypothetical protein [Vibrio spartinae]|uniref:hypothetical protein n=1 Tax=Vibrio spartinae TaxID=1918945 RepID=UPI00396A68FD